MKPSEARRIDGKAFAAGLRLRIEEAVRDLADGPVMAEDGGHGGDDH